MHRLHRRIGNRTIGTRRKILRCGYRRRLSRFAKFSFATVFRWLAGNQEFRQLYVLARQCQAEDLAYEILEIADDSSRDYVKKTGADGKVTGSLLRRTSPANASGLRPARGPCPGWRQEGTATAKRA
jgi:hypothetical protein